MSNNHSWIEVIHNSNINETCWYEIIKRKKFSLIHSLNHRGLIYYSKQIFNAIKSMLSPLWWYCWQYFFDKKISKWYSLETWLLIFRQNQKQKLISDILTKESMNCQSEENLVILFSLTRNTLFTTIIIKRIAQSEETKFT
jgi:hypothetical protein